MSRTVELRDAQGLEVTTRSGQLLVIAEPGRVNVEVEGLLDQSRRSQIWREGGRLHIRPGRGSSSLTIRCPVGADLSAASRSGHVKLRGDLGDVRLHTHSGLIEVERARSVEARTTNGRISIVVAHGKVSAATTSGKVDIQQAHSARAASVSGSIDLQDVRSKVDAMSVSGAVKVKTHGAGDIRVGTVSGSVDIRVPEDRRPRVRTRQKSGSQTVNCEEGDDLTITVATVSGAVHVGNHRLRVKT